LAADTAVDSVERLERALRLSLDWPCTVGFDGYFKDVPVALEQVLGYAPGELHTLRALDLVHPDDMKASRRMAGAVMREEGVLSIETRYRCKDGSHRWLMWRAKGDTRDRLVYAVARDIHERRVASDATRHERDFVSALLDTIGAVVVVLDGQGKIVRMNRHAELLTGWTFDEVRDTPFFETFLLEEERAGVRQQFASLRAGNFPARFENHWLTRSGERRLLSWSNTALLDDAGAVEFVIGTGLDVSEARAADDALRESEERYRQLVELSPNAIAIHVDGRIVFANTAAIRLLEADGPSQVIGMPVLNAVAPEFREVVQERMRRMIVGGEVGPLIEERFVTFKGQTIDVEVAAMPITVMQRRGVQVVFRDISARKQAESDLHRLNDELEQRVADRTAQLEAANRELEAFAYSVSHDLRAPLRSIDGFSQAVIEDCGGEVSDVCRGHLQRVRAASQRMASLIDALLTLSRVTRTEMNRDMVDLSALVREIASDLRRTEPERRVTFVVADGLRARGDPRLLRLAFENLLGNAWKFTSRNASARIEFGQTMREGRRTYFIRDDGAGFDMTYATKLFGAFQRLHAPTEFPGTGIGLATVQRIMNRHGGRVWAQSEAGKGATFFFVL